MKRDSLQGLGNIIEKMIEHTALGKHLEHAIIWQRWEEIVGKELAPRCHPVTIAEMRLSIEADSAVAMHALTLQKWPIIKRANTIAQKELINDIYVALLPDGDEISLEKTAQRPGTTPRGVNLRHIKHARPDDGPPPPVRKPKATYRQRRRGGS